MRRLQYRLRSKMAELHIRPGMLYEDCRYHPMLCIENDEGDLTGISLVDGRVGCCSYFHCGVVKLSIKEALIRRDEALDPPAPV